MLPVYDESRLFVIHIYSSTIAAVVAFIIGVILLSNVAYVYHKIQKKESHKKTAYLLVLVYLIFVTIASFSYSFVRTNVLTRISVTKFTTYQCVVGFTLSYGSFYLSTGLLYIIFVWRIHVTFKASAYAYNTNILGAFTVIISVVILILLLYLIWETLEAEWVILEHEGVSMCVNNASDHNIALKYSYMCLSIFTAVFHSIVSAVLLYMFVKGLWSINKNLIKSFVSDVSNNKKMNISIGNVLDHKLKQQKSTQNIRQILILYDLTKKQAILVSISVISSVTLWILTAVNDWISLELYWDVIINIICAWLMLASSKVYWKCCIKSCFRCCYRKENKIRKNKRSNAVSQEQQ